MKPQLYFVGSLKPQTGFYGCIITENKHIFILHASNETYGGVLHSLEERKSTLFF